MTNKNPPHRPIFPVNWETVDSMCAIQCTGEEIAGVLGCSYNTLFRACEKEHSCTFEEYFDQKKSNGRMSLRRKQYSTAMEGNPTMLVWLGKNWLGQADKTETAITSLPVLSVELYASE